MRGPFPSPFRNPAFALFLPPLTWFLFQQGLSMAMRAKCEAAAPPVGLLWGVASLLLCAFAGWLAWPVARSTRLEGEQIPRFLALLALIGAGIFALAICFQTVAIMVIPPCID